jgi:hypothetical protein
MLQDHLYTYEVVFAEIKYPVSNFRNLHNISFSCVENLVDMFYMAQRKFSLVFEKNNSFFPSQLFGSTERRKHGIA